MIPQMERYELIRLIGEGSMGVVYLARDRILNREVAIKALRPPFTTDPSRREHLKERFIREARIVANLRHPNIVTLYDAEIQKNFCWLIMEFVPGETLETLMQKRKDQNTLRKVTLQILSALEYAHKKGVIHRDLKPGNILISSGKVKITDFGIARPEESDLTGENQLLGSPSYMAPEQIRGEKVGPYTDLYALGVILYRWLTGRKPFENPSIPELFHAILSQPHPPPSSINPEIFPEWDQFFEKVLAKEPQMRVSSADRFRELFLATLNHPSPTPVQPQPVSNGKEESPSFIVEPPTLTDKTFHKIKMEWLSRRKAISKIPRSPWKKRTVLSLILTLSVVLSIFLYFLLH